MYIHNKNLYVSPYALHTSPPCAAPGTSGVGQSACGLRSQHRAGSELELKNNAIHEPRWQQMLPSCTETKYNLLD